MSPEEAQPEPVVAMVVLRPASGRPITGDSRITAENLGDYAPDPADAEAVAAALAGEGFEAGPLVGIAMSMSGPRRRFEEVFGTTVAPAEDGGWVAGGGTRELPRERLPDEIADRVQAVVFEPPAETTSPGDTALP